MPSQSSTIAFFLIAGFIVYVTMKGELPKYAAIIGLGAGGQSLLSSSPASSTPGSLNQTLTPSINF